VVGVATLILPHPTGMQVISRGLSGDGGRRDTPGRIRWRSWKGMKGIYENARLGSHSYCVLRNNRGPLIL